MSRAVNRQSNLLLDLLVLLGDSSQKIEILKQDLGKFEDSSLYQLFQYIKQQRPSTDSDRLVPNQYKTPRDFQNFDQSYIQSKDPQSGFKKTQKSFTNSFFYDFNENIDTLCIFNYLIQFDSLKGVTLDQVSRTFFPERDFMSYEEFLKIILPQQDTELRIKMALRKCGQDQQLEEMVCFDHKRSLALIFFHIAEKFSKQSEIIEELKSEREFEYLNLFKMIDKITCGFIDIDNLKNFCFDNGKFLSKNQLALIMKELSNENKHRVSFMEFKQAILLATKYQIQIQEEIQNEINLELEQDKSILEQTTIAYNNITLESRQSRKRCDMDLLTNDWNFNKPIQDKYIRSASSSRMTNYTNNQNKSSFLNSSYQKSFTPVKHKPTEERFLTTNMTMLSQSGSKNPWISTNKLESSYINTAKSRNTHASLNRTTQQNTQSPMKSVRFDKSIEKSSHPTNQSRVSQYNNIRQQLKFEIPAKKLNNDRFKHHKNYYEHNIQNFANDMIDSGKKKEEKSNFKKFQVVRGYMQYPDSSRLANSSKYQ